MVSSNIFETLFCSVFFCFCNVCFCLITHFNFFHNFSLHFCAFFFFWATNSTILSYFQIAVFPFVHDSGVSPPLEPWVFSPSSRSGSRLTVPLLLTLSMPNSRPMTQQKKAAFQLIRSFLFFFFRNIGEHATWPTRGVDSIGLMALRWHETRSELYFALLSVIHANTHWNFPSPPTWLTPSSPSFLHPSLFAFLVILLNLIIHRRWSWVCV